MARITFEWLPARWSRGSGRYASRVAVGDTVWTHLGEGKVMAIYRGYNDYTDDRVVVRYANGTRTHKASAIS